MVSTDVSENQPYPEDPYSELPHLSDSDSGGSGPLIGAIRADLVDKGSYSGSSKLVLPAHDFESLTDSIVQHAPTSNLKIVTDRQIAKVLYASAVADGLNQSDSEGNKQTGADIKRTINEQTKRYADELHRQLSLGGTHGHKYFAEKVRKGKEDLAKYQ